MLYIIPFLDALLLGLFAYCALRWFFREEKLKPLIAHTFSSLEEQMHLKLEAADIESEVDALLDQRLEALILLFQQQIPMASMLLSGPLAQKFKAQAKIEIMKMIPSLKERVLERLTKELDLKEWILNKVQEFDFVKRARPYIFCAALLGFLIGWINVFIVWNR